jgi:hypothetical protein
VRHALVREIPKYDSEAHDGQIQYCRSRHPPSIEREGDALSEIAEFRLIAFHISNGCGLLNDIAAFGADRIGADNTVLDKHLNDISALRTFHFQNCDGISGFLTGNHFCTPFSFITPKIISAISVKSQAENAAGKFALFPLQPDVL